MMSSKFVRVIRVEVRLRYLLDVMLPSRCMCGMLIGFTCQVYDLVVFDYGRSDVCNEMTPSDVMFLASQLLVVKILGCTIDCGTINARFLRWSVSEGEYCAYVLF